MTIIQKKIRSIPLNSLEKFMLSHESEEVSYNSQLAIEFFGEFKIEDFKFAVKKAISEIPLLRSYVVISKFSYKRFYADIDIDINDFVFFSEEIITQDIIDSFCQKKFDLTKPSPLSFLISKTAEGKHIIIFNIHHTICDAAGHFHILEEIFRVMNGLPIREGAKTDKVFRYRDLWKYMEKKWFLKQIIDQCRPLSKQRQYKMATLIDHPEKSRRFVSSLTWCLSEEEKSIMRETCKKLDISITEFLTYSSFKALDKSLMRKNDIKTPIMVYLPKTLRPMLKIRYSLQNILTTVWIVGKRDEIRGDKFLGKVKHIINSHKMDKAAKFIFGSLWACSFMRPASLQNYFKTLDQDPQSITSSLLISAGRVPRSFIFPTQWSDITVWARGTMLKSPGVGVIFTGVGGAETLTIEYLKDLTDKKTVELFKNDLMEELLTSY